MFCKYKKSVVQFLNNKKNLSFLTLVLLLNSSAYCGDEILSESKPPLKVVKVLSIDGGGMRGMLPATILAYLSKHTGKQVHEMFDVIGGTSAGGTICSLSASPASHSPKEPVVKAEELPNFLYKEGKNLLKQNSFPWSCFSSLYSAQSAKNVASKYFKDTLFDSQMLVPTVVATFDLSKFSRKLIKNWDKKEIFKTKGVVQATAAAPAIFPPYKLSPVNIGAANRTYTLRDGGVTDNDPTADVVEAAINLYPQAERYEVFSLGTGEITGSLKGIIKEEGFLSGILNEAIEPWFINQSKDSQKAAKKYSKVIKWRLNPPITTFHASATDTNPANLNYLHAAAENYIETHQDEIKTIVELLKTPKS